MLSLLATVLIVASVGAQHCCTPRAWEGEYYSGLGYIKTGEVEANFAKQKDEIWYDYDRKKSAYLHTTTYQDGTDRTFKLISHFNERYGYLVEDNLCIRFSLQRQMREFCVPSDSKVESVTYGSGSHTITGTRFSERINEDGRDLGAIARSFTNGECIPIEVVEFREERTHGGMPQTFDIVRGGTFANISPGISDLNELEPPETCITGAMPEEIMNMDSIRLWWLSITE